MPDPMQKLNKPPIVEAVLVIECDTPPALNLADLREPAKTAFAPEYPKLRELHLQKQTVQVNQKAESEHSIKRSFDALQLLHADERQLVQLRRGGFSFNRLAPYTTLDDYLGEMQRTWKLFVELAKPVQTRSVALRYINRIPPAVVRRQTRFQSLPQKLSVASG